MIRHLIGDAREQLPTLPDKSVQCVVTSPPYWGLRDYGTAKWEGGDAACDHLNRALSSDKSTLQGYTSDDNKLRTNGVPFKGNCGKCGAVRIDSQIGLEKTPDEYVAKMVAVFREVRRVLRDDGTLWLNLGDSYASGEIGRHDGGRTYGDDYDRKDFGPRKQSRRPKGIKPKDLVGIPWRVAFALQADGWYLRSDIIWHKPNPMPESVTDRPTKAHEYVFLLTKASSYFYDADAVREPHATPIHAPGNKARDNWQEIRGAHASKGMSGHLAEPDRAWGNALGRNRRSVWTVATRPYKGAHFATFPPKLIEPCILAGSRAGDMVLDPFGGAGTTGLVANRLGRDATLIELNPAYAQMSRDRIVGDAPLLSEVVWDRLGGNSDDDRRRP